MSDLYRIRSPRLAVALGAATAGLALAAPTAAFASPVHYPPIHHPPARPTSHRDLILNQVNLASDVPGLAPLTDPDLQNPWGVAATATSPLWVSDQGVNASTLYSLTPGLSTVTKSAAVRVTLPDTAPPTGPSGQVANPGTGFVVSNGTTSAPAGFIFDTLDGQIEAWSGAVDPHIGNAQIEATVPGAAFTGLAVAATKQGDDELIAANFGTGATGSIDVFNSAFKPVSLAPWQFTDPRLPKGYRPFNAQTLDGNVFVTYDTQDATTHLEGVGTGIGVVDEFSPNGRLIARVATGGPLNAPWGIAFAPASWKQPAGTLLIGNFGDGHINIYTRDGRGYGYRATGQILDASTHQPFAEPGLWALQPGTATNGGSNALWFTAGINSEENGLLGVLRP